MLARDVFDWVKFEGGDLCLNAEYTLTHTSRQTIAKIIAGSDEQLVGAALRLKNISPENNGMTIDEAKGFLGFVLLYYGWHELLTRKWLPKDAELRAFRHGLEFNAQSSR